MNANGGPSRGLSNSGHNPYLDGPVTFNFLWPESSESSIASVSNVPFLFGKTPDYVDGTCFAGCT